MLTSPGLPLGITGFTLTSSFTMLFARLVAGLLPVMVFKRELSRGVVDPLFAALSEICACCGLRWIVSR
jgi:hypothetical protein